LNKAIYLAVIINIWVTKKDGPGSFIVKSLVEAHGGTVWAENNIGGRGATFAFTLPLMVMNTSTADTNGECGLIVYQSIA
jgi:hypothetical protein